MKIQQLKESQKTQIENLGKWTAIRMYIPVSLNEAADAVQHGISSIHDDRQKMITPSFKRAAMMGEAVLPVLVTGEHIEVPDNFRSRENVQLAHKKYPNSKDPLVSMVLLSDKPIAYFTGSIKHDDISEIIVTGYNENGERINPGSERITIPADTYLKWYINKIIIPTKRKRLKD